MVMPHIYVGRMDNYSQHAPNVTCLYTVTRYVPEVLGLQYSVRLSPICYPVEHTRLTAAVQEPRVQEAQLCCPPFCLVRVLLPLHYCAVVTTSSGGQNAAPIPSAFISGQRSLYVPIMINLHHFVANFPLFSIRQFSAKICLKCGRKNSSQLDRSLI